MSEVLTASDAKQILEALQALQTDFQAMDKKLDIHIVRTEEQFKALNEKVDALKNDVTDLRTQQRATDSRLWAFVVGLVTLVGGGVIKVLWFDRA